MIKFILNKTITFTALLFHFTQLFAAYDDHRYEVLDEIDFQDQNLTYDNFQWQNLTDANFTNANLTNAILRNATLTGANFTNAIIKGVNFDFVKTLTKEQIYSTASYKNRDLSGISFGQVELSGIDFSGQNLSNIEFRWAVLPEANFTDASIKGTSFRETTSYGFTKEQLYSTASYKNRDLSGVGLNGNDLNGWDFSNQNLSNINFEYSVLTNTNFTNALIDRGNFSSTTAKGFTKEQLYATSSYKNHDLHGIKFGDNDLSGWDFSGQNLTDASFTYYDYSDYRQGNSNLSGANFADAVINGVDFSETIGLTKEQLYSTASYKNKDLNGVRFCNIEMEGWDFSSQDLSNVDLTNTMLTNAKFDNAKLVGADLRGSTGFTGESNGAVLKNTILSDGTIRNFSMDSPNDKFLIRNYYSQGSNYTGTGGITAKISEENAIISGGSELKLERGAQLEVINQKTLTIASAGILTINTVASSYGDPFISVDSLSELIFEDGANLFINVEIRGGPLFDTGDSASITLIEWEDGANIVGLSDLIKDENISLTLDGEKFDGEWNFVLGNNQFLINISQVPEPASCAAVFGVLTLLLALNRKKFNLAKRGR